MTKLIKPVSVYLVKGPFGYTIQIKRINRLRKVEAEAYLGDVLDLGYAKAEALRDLLNKFLEDQACIILDDADEIHQAIQREKRTLKRAEGEVEAIQLRIDQLQEGLERLNLDSCNPSESC